jgi:hypothetical protein
VVAVRLIVAWWLGGGVTKRLASLTVLVAILRDDVAMALDMADLVAAWRAVVSFLSVVGGSCM